MDFRELSYADAPVIKAPPPGPLSQEYLDYHFGHEGGIVSYPRGMPMALRRGRGATVEDVDGNVYIDFFGGAGVMNVGHGNPQVIAAIQEQIQALTHSLDFPTPARKALVETLLPLLPPELNRVSFGGPTGSDAVESAVKLARYNTKRYPILAFEGAYHGMTAGALTLCSGASFKEDFLPLIPEVHFAPYAYCYRCAFGQEAGSCDLSCARYVEHVLEDPHSGVARPAAIIVEPVQGEGGSIAPPVEFMQSLRRSCDRHGVLLIADEIQAGFCRTGKMFSFQHSGVLPDIVTMSKALGGVGMPISGIAYREEWNTWPPGKHIGTFRGNLAAYAAGAAALQFMVETDLAGHALALGEKIVGWLQEIERESRIVGEARGKGLLIGVEFVLDRATKEPAPELARQVRNLCHKRGLLMEIGGHYFNVARFLPPLVVTEDLARKAVEIFADSVRDVEAAL
ncbi:MAG: aspartate aminotransferase family protein [Anaerolineae bacterium]|jgi:diaminobutyrate-2-oxoglutarate transaminase|nr:aspartate aminotransferase family protein [Anaerolineae bacterium]MDX9831348.1 aspartate aminotransferase family protein [Anaerolineae bacterium]